MSNINVMVISAEVSLMLVWRIYFCILRYMKYVREQKWEQGFSELLAWRRESHDYIVVRWRYVILLAGCMIVRKDQRTTLPVEHFTGIVAPEGAVEICRVVNIGPEKILILLLMRLCKYGQEHGITVAYATVRKTFLRKLRMRSSREGINFFREIPGTTPMRKGKEAFIPVEIDIPSAIKFFFKENR